MKGIKVEGGLTESVLFELNYQTCVWPKTQNVERISVSITLLRAGDLKIWVAPTRSKRRCLGDRVVFLPGRKVGMGKLLMFHFKNQSLVSQRLYIIIYRYMDTVNSERLKKKTWYWPFKFRYVKDSSQTIKSKRNVENSLSGSVTWLCLPTPFLLTVSNAAHNISGRDHQCSPLPICSGLIWIFRICVQRVSSFSRFLSPGTSQYLFMINQIFTYILKRPSLDRRLKYMWPDSTSCIIKDLFVTAVLIFLL